MSEHNDTFEFDLIRPILDCAHRLKWSKINLDSIDIADLRI